ncbi:MAG: hypothetical protein WC869_11745 [Phycisphaerae bacterium]|jgi:hypothetical protein
MRSPKPDLTMTMEYITPEAAKRYLAANHPENRKVRRYWVKVLAGILKRGEYTPTHQGAALDIFGRLVDGQHRLLAIVDSGIGAWMWVCRGLPEHAFWLFDCGIKRSAADALGLSKDAAKVFRFIAAFVWGAPATHGQIKAIAESDLAAIHTDLVAFCPTTAKVFSTAAVRAAAVLTVAHDNNSADYVFRTYRALCLAEAKDLTAAGQSFLKQVFTGSVTATNHHELFARAWRLFSPENAKASRLVVKDHKPILTEVRAKAEAVLRPLAGLKAAA